MNNTLIRSIAGILFSVAVVSSFILGPWYAGFLFLFFSGIGVFELYKFTSNSGQQIRPLYVWGIAGAALIHVLALLVFFDDAEARSFIFLLPLFIIMLAGQLISLHKSALVNVSVTCFGWLYVSLPFVLLLNTASLPGNYSYEIPVGFFLILWANDTGAYFIGKFLGKHKLYPVVSPNKTWEGLFGGVAFAMLTGLLLSGFFTVLESKHWLVTGALVAVFGNIGDLFESHLKRTFEIKDSGNIIPGHGGVLDRFDGLFFSLPLVWTYLKFFVF